MGKFVIVLEDVPGGKVAITASGNPQRSEDAPPTDAECVFLELLETISECYEDFEGQSQLRH